MASKGPRSKLDHEPRPKRQKALETASEPRRPKAHWDHVLEEMIWLSKDFESERKWKLAQAKKVALRASKGMLDQATRGERKLKEEEQRLKKIALNISKDVKKFWLKIEKLVLCKHQMELDEKRKRHFDTTRSRYSSEYQDRYSTMLAENLGDSYKPVQLYPTQDQPSIQFKKMDKNDTNKSTELNAEPDTERADIDVDDDDYDVQSEDRTEDDENTIEEDEALFTEQEREEELAALQNEVDLPLEELLKQYPMEKESSTEKREDATEMTSGDDHGICPEKDEDGAEMTSVEEEHDMSPGKNGDGAELILLGKKDDTSPGKDEDSKELTSVEEKRVKQDEDDTKLTSVGEEQVMCSEKVEDAAEITSVGEEPGKCSS